MSIGGRIQQVASRSARFSVVAVAVAVAGTTGGLTQAQENTPTVDQALAEFSARLREMRAAFHELPARPEDPDWVKAKLAHMVEVDQYTRSFTAKPQEWGYDETETQQFFDRFMPRWKLVDAANTEDVKMLLAIHGWFKISTFGEEADHQAWLLVQHADQDPDLQREVLKVLEELLKTGDTKPANYAYLYDRVASAEDRPQRYGTQGRCVAPGIWEPNELEDPGGVDERRSSVGLGPLAEYRKRLNGVCP